MVTLPEFGKCKFFPALPGIVGRWTPEGDCRGFTSGGLAPKIRARRKRMTEAARPSRDEMIKLILEILARGNDVKIKRGRGGEIVILEMSAKVKGKYNTL